MECKNCGKQIGNPKATHCLDCATKEFHDSMTKTFPWWPERNWSEEDIMHDLDHLRRRCDCDD